MEIAVYTEKKRTTREGSNFVSEIIFFLITKLSIKINAYL